MKKGGEKNTAEETKFFDMKETVALDNSKLSTDTAEYTLDDVSEYDTDFEEYEYQGHDYEDDINPSKKKKLIIIGVIVGALIIGILSVVYLVSKKEYIEEVVVYVDGVEVETLTKVEEGTLEDRLNEAGYTEKLYKTDTSEKKTDKTIYLLQKKQIEVTYATKQWDRSEQTVYQYTLDQVLNELKVDLSDDSTIYLNNTKIENSKLDETPVTDKDYVKIVDNKTVTEYEETVIPFSTVEQPDKNLPKGTTEVVTEGQDGLKRTTYEVKYVDGKEVSREIVKEEVIKQPVNKVVKVGTKEPDKTPPPTTPSGDTKPNP